MIADRRARAGASHAPRDRFELEEESPPVSSQDVPQRADSSVRCRRSRVISAKAGLGRVIQMTWLNGR